MPTILRIQGYRFFFFSLEGNEPPHIHIEHGDKVAKFWLKPINLASSIGFRSHELTEIRMLVIAIEMHLKLRLWEMALTQIRKFWGFLHWRPFRKTNTYSSASYIVSESLYSQRNLNFEFISNN